MRRLRQSAQAPRADRLYDLAGFRANQSVAAVVAKCASQGYAETGVLVDADGVQQAVLRGNRAGAHMLDSAFAKAYTSASFKTDTTAR